MKLAIMQPYLFPYIGYFQLIKAVDKFIIFDDVNYIKKGWINRNKILINGKEYLFTIPLEKASQNKLIKEIELSVDNVWEGKFLNTIFAAYKKAPMFMIVFPVLEEILSIGERNLSSFISNSISRICKYLEIDTLVIKSSFKYETSNLRGQEKILRICSLEKADTYINPIGGLELYQKEAFEKQNTKLLFLKSKTIKYQQFKEDFVPFLSIIDILMFNTKDEICGYLNEYELL
jgi:hypothetical protein